MQRLEYRKIAPAALEPLYHANRILEESGLEPKLLALVSLRASQINGCAFCIALHTREAAALGESSDRLHGLVAWREAPWYSERERAALEWTEHLTRIADAGVPDELYERVARLFSAQELAYLTLAVATINSWNRFAISFRTPPSDAEAIFQWLHSQRTAGEHPSAATLIASSQ